MPSFVELIEKLDLPKAEPPVIPASVGMVLDRLGLTMSLTSPSAPEQYSILKDGIPSGYIRVRWGGMSIDYPDAGDECLHDGAVDGFGGFSDHEREPKLLLALGLIAARMLKA
jgi:hypothetical protein